MVFAFVLSALALQEPAAPTGPVAYWKLDETSGTSAANAVAGAPAGTYQNGPTPSTTVAPLSFNTDPGVTARSLQFNGSNQGLQIANFGTFTQFTVSTWIQRTGSTGARQAILSYKESGASLVLSLNEDGVNVRPRIWTNINGTWQNAEEAFTIPIGAWVHLAATFDATTLRLYRDGTQVATGAFAGTMANGSATTGIAMRNSYDQHYFPGLIDDARIYSRALSAAEVGVLAAGVPAPSGLNATGGIDQIDVSWTAPAGSVAYTYALYRSPAGAGTFTLLAGNLSGTAYTDTATPGGTSWDYYVVATSFAVSGRSTTATGTATSAAPRTSDHEEGLNEGECACGSAGVPEGVPFGVAIAALATAALGRRVRRKRS
jgi:hypothetical protein